MTTTDRTRRTVLKASGATLTLALVAGCLGEDDDSNGNGDDGNGDDGNGGDTDEYDFDGWFDSTDNYDGVHDETGADEVTVMNGTGSAGYEYDPAAIKVDPGTTVVWEWTGAGGGHTVTDDGGDFDSGNISGEGETFEHTFDEEGVYKYYCVPHETMGQMGAVVVE